MLRKSSPITIIFVLFFLSTSKNILAGDQKAAGLQEFPSSAVYEQIIPILVENAQRKIDERHNWLSKKHSEGKIFSHLTFPEFWYMFVPVYPCLWDFEKKPGADVAHDGGKWICGLKAMETSRNHLPTHPCIVYSFGSRGNFIFENQVRKSAPSCQIFTFDPTWKPKNKTLINGTYYEGKRRKNDPYNKYFLYGVSNIDTNKHPKLYFPTKKLETILEELGHNYIDILKMDVERSEWDILENVDWNLVRAGQLLIEFHPLSHFEATVMNKVFNKLEANGFLMTSLEPVTKTNLGQVEAAFIHKDWRPRGFSIRDPA